MWHLWKWNCMSLLISITYTCVLFLDNGDCESITRPLQWRSPQAGLIRGGVVDWMTWVTYLGGTEKTWIESRWIPPLTLRHCVSPVISDANTKVGLILYSKWITSLGGSIPHHDGGSVWGRLHGQSFSILDFSHGSWTLAS